MKKRTGFNRTIFPDFLILKFRKFQKIEKHAKRTGFYAVKKRCVKSVKKERGFSLKNFFVRYPPYKGTFWAKKNGVFRGQKSCFTLF